MIVREIFKFAAYKGKALDFNLEWLVETAVRDMREWMGVGELRGLWCTVFPPADGAETSCSIPGHRSLDIYEENLEKHQETKAEEQAEWKLLNPAGAAQEILAKIAAAPTEPDSESPDYQKRERMLQRDLELFQIYLRSNKGRRGPLDGPRRMPQGLWDEWMALRAQLKRLRFPEQRYHCSKCQDTGWERVVVLRKPWPNSPESEENFAREYSGVRLCTCSAAKRELRQLHAEKGKPKGSGAG